MAGNTRLHCCVIDGVFSAEDEALRFDQTILTPEPIAKVQAEVGERVLRLSKRRALLSPEDVEAMRAWGHEGGFSLNADVTVAAWDRTGLERLLRYCARPIFASERLQWIEKDERLVYRLPKPMPGGQTVLYLTPLKFLDKLAMLIPSPAVTAYAGVPMGNEVVSADQAPVADEDRSEPGSKTPFYAASVGATLIARIYEVWMKYFPVFHTACSFQLPKSVPDGFVPWFALNAVAN